MLCKAKFLKKYNEEHRGFPLYFGYIIRTFNIDNNVIVFTYGGVFL